MMLGPFVRRLTVDHLPLQGIICRRPSGPQSEDGASVCMQGDEEAYDRNEKSLRQD